LTRASAFCEHARLLRDDGICAAASAGSRRRARPLPIGQRGSAVLNKLRRAIDYLESPELRRARARGVRVDFVAELVDLRDRFGLTPGTVVDVGANRGDFVRAVRFVHARAHVVAFEPIPALHERLRAEFEPQGCEIFPYALDAGAGPREFFHTQADDLSSLLPPTAELTRSLREGAEATKAVPIRIEARRLDDVLDLAKHPGPVLLKLDVQGGELRALRGATRQLEHVTCVKLEHHFDRLYDGQSELADIVRLMQDRGFPRMLQINAKVADGRLRWCDFLFFR
jgi:FkbM family methyltransferase